MHGSAETKTIIFDFDGTLADSFWHNVSLLARVGLPRGVAVPTKSEIENLRNNTAQEILRLFKITKIKLFLYMWRLHRLSKATNQRVDTFTDIKKMLKSLQDLGFSLLILTSNSKKTVANFLQEHDLAYFDEIYSEFNLFGKDKALAKIIKSRKLNKNLVYYVGDETRDIEACKRVGVKVIAVTWGYNSVNVLRKFNPEFVVSSPFELVSVLT